jgi:hypothetical protein
VQFPHISLRSVRTRVSFVKGSLQYRGAKAIPLSGETWSVLVGVCPGTKQGVPHGSPSIILCTFVYKIISNLPRIEERGYLILIYPTCTIG